MKKSSKIWIAVLWVSCLICGVTSCSKGPAQQAGEQVDNAVQNTKNTLTNN
jgi:hypothetical protein